MHFVSFQTDAPVSLIQTALNELARSGFTLCGLHMTTAGSQTENGSFVRIDYSGRGNVDPDNFYHRIERLVGLRGINGGSLYTAPLQSVEAEGA